MSAANLTERFPSLTPEVLGTLAQLPVNLTKLAELPVGEDPIGAVMLQLYEGVWPKNKNGIPVRPMADQGNLVKNFSWAITIIMLVVVCVRMHSRFWHTRMAGWEDYMTIPAVITAVAMHVMTLDIVNHGVGQHVWNLSGPDISHIVRGAWISNMIYVCVLIFMKISVLFQLLRICAPKSKTRMALLIVFGVSLASSGAIFLTILLQCQPTAYLWERVMMNPFDPATMNAGKCLAFTTVTYTTGAITIVMDLTIWVVPMPMVAALKVNRVQKISLFIVFSVSGLVAACAIGRLIATTALTAVDKSPVQDFPYLVSSPIIWSVAEGNIAIIGPSLPAIRPLLKTALPSIFGSMNSNKLTRSNDGGYIKNGSGHMHSNSGHMQSNISQPKAIPLQSRGRSKVSHPLDIDYGSSTEELHAHEENGSVGSLHKEHAPRAI